MTTRTTEKRQYVNLLVWAAAILMLVLASMPHRAEAAEKYAAKISTLKQNTWTLQKDSDYNWNTNTITNYYWKITVPADGYLKIQVNSSKNYPWLSIYKTVKTTSSQEPYDYNKYSIGRTSLGFESTVSIRQVLKKGTYYLQGMPGVKYRWSFIKVKNPNTLNYCKFRAKTVKSGVKQSILFNPGYEYSRWFKVVLPQKKTITVALECLDGSSVYEHSFTVYKANGTRVNCPALTNKTFRTPSLPKGTYYVCLHSYYLDEGEMTSGRLFSFSWK